MLLDHNSTTKVAWNTGSENNVGRKKIYNQLKIDTNGWSKVETLINSANSTYCGKTCC